MKIEAETFVNWVAADPERIRPGFFTISDPLYPLYDLETVAVSLN